jgi:DNA repair exonuclease SbcCD ATPase subunit
MKLQRLHLENFRQFRDETLEFAQDGTNNVTVIHGPNGSGKTTLLNAFTWLLYENVDFDTRPDRLASEGAMADARPGDEITVKVSLEFHHEGATYTATRTAVFEKQSSHDFDGKAVDHDLVVKYEDETGTTVRNNPENTLGQIIPERLSELFFFDGEDIDELAGIDNQERIQESIQNIMGLTILERAKRHLDTVAGRFEDEFEEVEQENALLAKRRQRAAEMVRDDIDNTFEGLKDKVRQWSNTVVRNTFDEIATKDLDAEITEDFELKIRQTVSGSDEQVEVDKSTGERQIASLAFIGSLVQIAKSRYESDSGSEHFTGGIYPLVMDSPFGALDKDHRREVSRILPKLAPQVVVFVTDSQWEGPVEDEMEGIAGKQYWLNFDDGKGTNSSPQTRIETDRAAVTGD